MKNIISLFVDRLHHGFLGTYGNGEVETPALNHLAAESFVADRYYLDSPQLTTLYRSLWRGAHAFIDENHIPEKDWIETLVKAGYHTVLLTDDVEIAYSPYRGCFAQVELLPDSSVEILAETTEETHLFSCFASLIMLAETLTHAGKPFLLWCHFRAFDGLWDVPMVHRDQYVCEEDPAPYSSLTPPYFLQKEAAVEEDFLDIRQSCVAAYSGAITLFDELFEPFYQLLSEGAFGHETLFLLAGTRGIPMGEHGQVGISPDESERLYGELIHVPLMVRYPDSFAASTRSQALLQPWDIGALISEWADVPSSPTLISKIIDDAPSFREHVFTVGRNQETAITTSSWFFRISGEKDSSPELYVKPDDHWEVNDVANRCDEVVASFVETTETIKQRLAKGDFSVLLSNM